MRGRVGERVGYLKNKKFLATIADVTAFLKKLNVGYAMIGGMAVAYHANPPVTPDVDFLIDTENMDPLEILLAGEGWQTVPIILKEQGLGFPDFGFAGRKPDRMDIDIISTSGDSYLSEVVSNAREVVIGSVKIPVVTVEDLIVIKTLVNRDKDFSDVRELRLKSKVDDAYIRRTLKRLHG
jgi:predicted nucleotidyltransferase